MIRGLWTAFTVSAMASGIVGFLLWLGMANGVTGTIVSVALSAIVLYRAVVRIREIPLGAAWGLALFFALPLVLFLALFMLAAMATRS